MITAIRKCFVYSLLFLLLFFTTAQLVQAQEPAPTVFWVHRVANIRSEPTTAGGDSTIVATAMRGEQLNVVDEVTGEIPSGWHDNDIWYVVQLSDDEVGYVYSALVAGFLLPPQGNEDNVLIEPLIIGSESFKVEIRDALNLLRDRDSESYAFVNEWLDGIVESFYICRVVRGETVARIGINCMRYGRTILAVTLVHEACHVMRSEKGLISGGLPGERACLGMELETLRVIDPHNRNLARGEKFYRNIDEDVCQWWRYTFNKRQCLAMP